jgi:hypothetical protein
MQSGTRVETCCRKTREMQNGGDTGAAPARCSESDAVGDCTQDDDAQVDVQHQDAEGNAARIENPLW